MAHALGLEVIAEGIETPIQRDRLLELGCRLGQGFLLGTPVAGNAFAARLGWVVAADRCLESVRAHQDG